MSKIFKSPYVQYHHRNNQPIEVIGLKNKDEYDFEEVGELFRVKFSDGEVIDAWPEEIHDN